MSHTETSGAATDYLTFSNADQTFAVPAVMVRDVLKLPALTPVPLARPEIAGLMNLRGHIVTALNLAVRLGMPRTDSDRRMAIVVERNGESYCLAVERVGDVIRIVPSELEPNPASVTGPMAALSRGVFKARDRLLLALDLDRVFALAPAA